MHKEKNTLNTECCNKIENLYANEPIRIYRQFQFKFDFMVEIGWAMAMVEWMVVIHCNEDLSEAIEFSNKNISSIWWFISIRIFLVDFQVHLFFLKT